MAECPKKPRQPTLIGITWHIQPHSQHAVSRISFSSACVLPPDFLPRGQSIYIHIYEHTHTHTYIYIYIYKQHFENLLGNPPKVTHEPITRIISKQLDIKLGPFTQELNSVLRKIKNR